MSEGRILAVSLEVEIQIWLLAWWFPGRHCIFIVLDILLWRSVEKAEWGCHLAKLGTSRLKMNTLVQ